MATPDVIVVGGGPAGASAALVLARGGARVRVLDSARFPRDKTCGDALGLDCARELEALGLMARTRALARCSFDGVGLTGPSGRRVALRTVDRVLPGFADHTFCIPRIHFDEMLIGSAVEAGAELVEGCRVQGLVRRSDGRVTGVRSADGQVHTADVVLGCAGEHDPVAKAVGRVHDPRHRAFAVRVYVAGLSEPVELAEIALTTEVLPGYGWIFPVSPTEANVGVGLRADLLKQRGGDLRGMLRRFMADEALGARLLHGGEPTGPVRGWPLSFGTQERATAGDGWLLCGDAAGMIDPITGEGIGPALLSGRLAAETVLAGDLSAAGLQAYERAWTGRLRKSFRAAKHLQGALMRPWVAERVVRQAQRRRRFGTQLAGMVAGALPKTRAFSPAMLGQFLV